MLIFSSFVLVFAVALLALQRMDEVYQTTERTVIRAMLAVLRDDDSGTMTTFDLRGVLVALERLERIAVSVDLRATGDELTALHAEIQSVAGARSELAEQTLSALERLDLAIVEKRSSIARSFYVLIAALALSLVVSIIVGAFLSLKLRLSRVEADWSQRSLKRALAVEEQLRKRIANDLHDDAAQELAAAKMLCERAAAGFSAETDAESAAERALEAARLLSSAGRKIRSLAIDLRPPELEHSGLVAALGTLCGRSCDRTGHPATFSHDGTMPEMSDETAIQAYRIVQEAVNNARKHAAGNRIEVAMSRSTVEGEQGLVIAVRDYPEIQHQSETGNETEPGQLDAAVSSGLGLTIMHERAVLAGGRLSVGTEGSGYLVSVFIPDAVQNGAQR